MKIVVCAISIGNEYNNKEWVKYALNNHKKYCTKHNYDYILRTKSKTNRIPTWEKIDIIKELILTKVERANLQNEIDQISKPRKLTWKERISGNLLPNTNLSVTNTYK